MELAHDHVAIRVADYDAAVRWYVEKLDFVLGLEWPVQDMRLCYLTNGAAKLELIGDGDVTEQPPAADLGSSFRAGGYHHVCLAVASVDDAVAELRRRGVTILAEPFDAPEIERRLAFLQDPSGNAIELCEQI